MEHTRKNLIEATKQGSLYDYIANNYTRMSNYELKEVLLAVLGVELDKCGVGANRDEEEAAYSELLVEELASRGYEED